MSVFHHLASQCVSFAVKLEVALSCGVPVLSASRHVKTRLVYVTLFDANKYAMLSPYACITRVDAPALSPEHV